MRSQYPHSVEALTRRDFLGLCTIGAAACAIPLIPTASAAAASAEGVPIGGDHVILPRDEWGADLPPTGPMAAESPEDVRFLLVHHSASPNNYPAEQSIEYLRSFYRYHTSAQKGWPDIAYNFLIDKYGQIFEGRQGSIKAPVRGDATGGSQGYALLSCFIGDHSDAAPTNEAQSAMVALLAWLAGTYSIDPAPGSTTEFVSRGSNLHPEGKLVTTPTITGHRMMSRTTCPGDQAFALVQNSFPARVRDALDVTPSTAVTGTTAEPAAVVTTSTPTTVAPTTTPPTTVPSTTQAPAQPTSDTTRPPTVADTAPAATTTTQAASASPTTVHSPTAAADTAPTTSTLPSQETLPEHSIQTPESDNPDSQRDSLLTYWPYAAMSLGVSTLVAVNVIQRRITNQHRSPKEENTTS